MTELLCYASVAFVAGLGLIAIVAQIDKWLREALDDMKREQDDV